MPTSPPVHRPPWVKTREQAQRDFHKANDARRGTSTARGYDWNWRKIRAAVLAESPLCLFCESTGRVVIATVVDHIKPLAEGGGNERENLRPLCKPCHDRHTALTRGFAKIAAARGFASGKT